LAQPCFVILGKFRPKHQRFIRNGLELVCFSGQSHTKTTHVLNHFCILRRYDEIVNQKVSDEYFPTDDEKAQTLSGDIGRSYTGFFGD
jgi:hypothetical protein